MESTRSIILWLSLPFVMAEIHVQPEQIHLAYGKLPTDMVVTWVTMDKSEPSLVEFGYSIHEFNFTTQGQDAILFTDGGSEHRTMYIHKVILSNLKPDYQYFYHVGNSKGWSEVFYFKTIKSGSEWSPRFAVYGDLGNANAQSLSYLQEEVQKGFYDAVIHAGDFAYDLVDDNARVGDAFMNQIQPIAAYVPYMTCPGNHEFHYNFLNYKSRFNMPTDDNGKDINLFFSFNVGPAHIISLNTEAYFFWRWDLPGGNEAVLSQYKWLEQDLIEANKPENRAARPWIITMGHRPLYCSNDDMDKCEFAFLNPIRRGMHNYTTREYLPGLEDILYNYGVDLEIYAHEHSYERLFPLYNMTVCNGTISPYVDPRAPVHIITGSAGDKEIHDKFLINPYYYSAFHSTNYGYTRMNIINSTHLYLEQVSIDQGGDVIDKVMLVKTKHGAGLYDCHKSNTK